jgi:hypothetical protein
MLPAGTSCVESVRVLAPELPGRFNRIRAHSSDGLSVVDLRSHMDKQSVTPDNRRDGTEKHNGTIVRRSPLSLATAYM